MLPLNSGSGRAELSAEDQVLDARLSDRGHRDRLAVAAKSRRNPENIDFKGFAFSGVMFRVQVQA